jgi:hypothetical protein
MVLVTVFALVVMGINRLCWYGVYRWWGGEWLWPFRSLVPCPVYKPMTQRIGSLAALAPKSYWSTFAWLGSHFRLGMQL